MRKNKILFVGIIAVVSLAQAEDQSGVTISLGTNQQKLPVHMVVIDPLGRKTGHVSEHGPFFNEIPNSSYEINGISGPEDFETDPQSVQFNAEPLVKGSYLITLYPTRSCDFHIGVQAMDSNEINISPESHVVSGVFTTTETPKSFNFTVDPAPGAGQATLTPVVTNSLPILPTLACVEKKDGKGHWGSRHGHHKFRGHHRRRPFLKHRGKSEDFIAVFGYENKNASPVDAPIGPDNRFSPAPEDRGQPETFDPGVAEEAFEVPFDKKTGLTWTLKGPDGQVRSVTADKHSPECR